MTVSSNLVSCMEKEKERVLFDLRRITAENEALREKLEVSNSVYIFLKGNLLRIWKEVKMACVRMPLPRCLPL